MNTPLIDAVIEWLGQRHGNAGTFAPAQTIAACRNLLERIKRIQSHEEYSNRIWPIWLRSERGPITEFGDFNEFKEMGEVETYGDFEELWKSYFPEEITWHEITLIYYDHLLGFAIDSKCRFEVDFASNEISNDFNDGETKQFLSWLLSGVEREVEKFLKAPDEYNDFLEANLPKRKRYGKIKRLDIWEGLDDAIRLDEELGVDNLRCFERVVRKLDERAVLKEMTLERFLEYCEKCYDANGYFEKLVRRLSAREKYIDFADGRHEGLLEIDGQDPDAFLEWYTTKHGGGHPWEICRGGNSTHISLQVARDGDDWKLYLAGFSRARVVETARMAIALFESNIPFILVHKDAMLRMLQGIDWLGIVPDTVTPRYCHASFPDEDRVFDFINPWFDPDIVSLIEKKAIWYPVEKLSPAVE